MPPLNPNAGKDRRGHPPINTGDTHHVPHRFSHRDCWQPAQTRLAGVEIPAYEDNERTFEELKARVAKTVAFVQTFTPAQIDGTEDKDIVTKRGDKETHYKGMQFLLGHAMPNVYFHVTTAFAILRHNGVEIGKRDFLGNP